MDIDDPRLIEHLRGRVWPAFWALYEEGGDNVSTLHLSMCDIARIDRFEAAVNSRGRISSVFCEPGGERPPSEFSGAMRALVSGEVVAASGGIEWQDREYFWLADARKRNAAFDLELCYGGANEPLIDESAPDAERFAAFMRFVGFGVLLQEAGNAALFALADHDERYRGDTDLVVLPILD